MRVVFNLAHHWTGRLAAGFAIANVFIGLHVAAEFHKFYWWDPSYGSVSSALKLPKLALGPYRARESCASPRKNARSTC